MSELERIIDKYFRKDGTGIVYYDIDQDIFNKVVSNVDKYEKPDILSVLDDVIVGIEHFEFDSFKKNKKGSDFRIKDVADSKEIQKKLDEQLQQKDSAIVNSNIKSTSSLHNYFNNFIQIFAEHYNKIDSYFDHIEKDFEKSEKEVVMCFFAEDVTPLGNYFLDTESKINLLNPLYSDEVIEKLMDSPKIKYLIIGLYAMNDYKLIIIENKKSTFEKFKKERKIVKEENFFSFNPMKTSFASKVSSE